MIAVGTLLRDATAALSPRTEQPALEAQMLLAYALEKPRSWLFAWPEKPTHPDAAKRFRELLQHRLEGMPIAYLIGQREFWSLLLEVTPATLIPRPETECLVEVVLALDLPDCPRILELGTGSGAIAIALAHERPAASVVATDASLPALNVARRNAVRLGLADLRFVAGRWFEALAPDRRFDVVVSNPPYIAEQDAHLAAGDLRFEPRLALASGPDGFDAIRTLIAGAPRHLRAKGWLWLEHGADQAETVRSLLQEQGFEQIRTGRDLAGLERYSGGQLPHR